MSTTAPAKSSSTQYSVPSNSDRGRIVSFKSVGSIGIELLNGRGRGVVAHRPITAGELIERAPVIVIGQDDVPLLRQTRLEHYYFEWGADCQQAAIALGYGSLYNHSYTPNARYVFRESEECLEFIALREIQAGEEITINYNNLEESAANPLPFTVH